MSDLEISQQGDVLVVDSRLLAPRLNIKHLSFMATLGTYQTQLDQYFGIVRFEIEQLGGRGRPQRYALLTEDQATFIMTDKSILGTRSKVFEHK